MAGTALLSDGITAAAEQRPGLPLYRFTVEQYHRMIEAGVLTENDRVELLEGLVVARPPPSPPHDTTVDLTRTEIAARVPEDWPVRVKSAITLADSEPAPDVAVVRGPGRRYLRSHPRPADIALLVEVADATLGEDQTEKVRVYARARIPVYWIANLTGSVVEVYTQPRAGRNPAYRQRTDYGPDEMLPLVIAGEEVGQIAVRDLLP